MKTYLIILSCLLALPVEAFAQTVMIGTVDAYEAGDYTVDPSALENFDKAFGELLCQRGKFDCAWKVMGRDELVPALKARKIDVIIAAIPMTEAFGDGVETTAAYLYPDPFAIVGLPGFVPFGNVKTVAAVPDPAIEAWHATSGYNILYFPTLEEALREVEGGGAEIAFGEYEDLAPLVDATEGRLEVLNPGRHLRPGVTMALRSESIDLRFAIEDLIYDMSKDGSLNALNKELLGNDAVVWQ
ncbi:transporter substrate-binding domain-containing protein [Seohaeicola saemankumensis]|uniref:Transporter substrate-binding domain-containing protein n=1 Tax=Seohaeicola saemankumensis TaxID=481181 RepID=A0ABW3TJP4_9RHOB